ncbi:MAG: PD-(D/E)XK nuclease family protein [Proteobacteria bacterium]|nr:PD-(D/E)XK nuclease family protein [Pseudomonadota bacterium]
MDETSKVRSTTVTGSDRLARRLHERAADAQLAAGRRAWERPDILPVGAFWRRLLADLQQDSDLPPARQRLLSRQAMQCRWELLVETSFADEPLLQTKGAAKSALDAWQMCRDWQLDTDALANDPLEETRLLVAWGRQFEKECAARGLLPEYALPNAVLDTLERFPHARARLPETIRFAGFIETTPLEVRHRERLRVLGVTIENVEPPSNDARMRVVACDDHRHETAVAAAWAREQLAAAKEGTRPRLGIIVPDLAGRRASLNRALTETLCPERATAFDDTPLPFNFSLGEPLAERALVADALTALGLARKRVEFADAARLCRSPYIGAKTEYSARLHLESVMRHNGYAEFSLNDFRFIAGREHCLQLAAALEKFIEALRESGDTAAPSMWARRFSQWLEILGWCRFRTLDSNEYQAREAFNVQLGRLGELDVVLGKCPRNVALSWLNRLANETPFQPRAADAPVQVIGLLEATGMQFDAVWVMGLTDDVLPAAPRPNPFLPIEIQRAGNLPQSSAARELEFAQDIFDGLKRAAPNVICSYPLREGDSELGASPLLRDIDIAAPVDVQPSPARQWFRSTPLETLHDTKAPVHPGGETRGGTALLQDQSHCPFRAFAIHRLHAGDWPTPQPGPDALIRGLLTHRVLEKLWVRWRTRKQLQATREADELEAIVRAVVIDVLDDNRRKMHHRWTDSLQTIETERLVNVLMRWFEQVELQRPDFDVIEIEGENVDVIEIEGENVDVIEIEGQGMDGGESRTRVLAGPLELAGKLDRVDRLPDGSELIIDYKSGEAPGKNDFFGERPRAPQLPAYLVARRQAGKATAAGIAVASLKTGNEKLQGVMRVEGDSDPGIAGLVNVVKTRQVGDWEEAVEFWERKIHALGTAFANGDADVDPLRGTCDYCHLATLCRIHELRRENAEEEIDE